MTFQNTLRVEFFGTLVRDLTIADAVELWFPLKQGVGLRLNYVTLAVVAVALTIFAARATHLQLTPAHMAGIAILVPSFVLFAMARLRLGGAFSIEAKATTLVTTGIYSRIRNPIYVFGSLMIAGVIVLVGKPIFFLVFLFILPMQVLRARNEERVLQEKFGDAYLEYKRKTWF